MSNKLVFVPFENLSGKSISGNEITLLKGENFRKREVSVGGDAPKDVIAIYQYRSKSKIRKSQPKTWPIYIAKVGHKWYPNESITEQLITEIGKVLKINIADSALFQIEGTLRFCSKHFHNINQRLNHGAEILSTYRGEPNQRWIDQLEMEKKIKNAITIEEIISAIKMVFHKNATEICQDFFKMLLFDCFIGNNDRHYYNWGVITSVKEQERPYFSPIYDTARGLWWNTSDEKIVSLHTDIQRRSVVLNKYIKNSTSKITIPDNPKCNHFDLIQYIWRKEYLRDMDLSVWQSKEKLRYIYDLIDNKFRKLMILERRELIKSTLRLRHEKINQILC